MDDFRPVIAKSNDEDFKNESDASFLPSVNLDGINIPKPAAVVDEGGDAFDILSGRGFSSQVAAVFNGADNLQSTAQSQDQILGSDSGKVTSMVAEIETDKVFPNPFQPRKFFDPQSLQELSDSIREHGVIQPIVVTKVLDGYEIVVGERRFRASVLAGLKTVPAIIKVGMQDQAKLEVALIENIQRHKLNPIEEARGFERLIKSFGLTQEQVGKKLGKSRPAITNTLRLLQLPVDIQRAIMEGRLSEGQARPLVSIADKNQQVALFQEILERGLSARQIEAKARELTVRRTVDGVAPDPKLLAAESELHGTLGTQVRIHRQGKGGKIMIEFFSDEELDEILNRMKTAQESIVASDMEGFLAV